MNPLDSVLVRVGMEMINVRGLLLATVLTLGACSESGVPDSDKAAEYLNAGDIAAAKLHIRNALKTNGSDPELIFLNGRIALEDGNADLAVSEFSKLLDHAKFGNDSRVYLAQAYLLVGNPKQALATLGTDRPATGLATAVAVSALLAIGDSSAAVTLLDQGLRDYPDTPELMLLDATRALQMDDGKRALAIAERAAELAPNNVNVVLFRAKAAMQERDFAAANGHFDRALELRPNSQIAMLGKAAAAYDVGKRDEARKWIAKASESIGGAEGPLVLFDAQIAYDAGKYDEANQIINAIKDMDRFPEAYRVAGMISAKRGTRELAITQLRGYFRHGGDNLGAKALLASLLNETGQYDEAWRVLRPIADAPNANQQVLLLASSVASKLQLPNAAGYGARAQALAKGDPNAKQMIAAEKAMQTGDWKAAEKIYAGLARSPANANNVVLINNYANVLVKVGKAGEAVTHARKAYALAPADPTVLDTLGWTLYQAQGFSPEALRHLEAALSASPNNPTIRSHFTAVAAAAS